MNDRLKERERTRAEETRTQIRACYVDDDGGVHGQGWPWGWRPGRWRRVRSTDAGEGRHREPPRVLSVCTTVARACVRGAICCAQMTGGVRSRDASRVALRSESRAERERRKRPRDRPTDKQLAMQLAPGLARAYRRSAVLCRPYTKIIQRCTTHPAAAPPPAPPGPGGRATTHTRTFRARAVRPSHSRRAALQLHMHVLQCAHPHDARKAQHHWRSAWGAAGGVGGF